MKQKAIRISPWAPPELSFGEMAAVTIGGLFMLVLGIWAFFAPASLADFVAFPYNRHLLHDVGAFQIGIGTTMLLALMWTDGVMMTVVSGRDVPALTCVWADAPRGAAQFEPRSHAKGSLYLVRLTKPL